MNYTKPQMELVFSDIDEILEDCSLESLLLDLQIDIFPLDHLCRRRINLIEIRLGTVLPLSEADKSFLHEMWVDGFISLMFLKETEDQTWPHLDANQIKFLETRHRTAKELEWDGDVLAAIRNRSARKMSQHRTVKAAKMMTPNFKAWQKRMTQLGVDVFCEAFAYANEYLFMDRP